MPSISFSFEDLCKLTGKKLGEEELTILLDRAKAELDSKLSSEITVKYNDTNQPYLWSVEGLARHFRASLGKDKGVPKIRLEKSDIVVNVDKSVAQVRPFMAVFQAKGAPLSEYLLNQLIQLQEKLADNYGRKRQKFGIGIFPAKGMSFPMTYKAVAPGDLSFVPLGMKEKLTLREIVAKHQKGKEYGHLLKDAKKYPIILNAKNEVLSFPPIINSETSGKVKAGDSEMLVEVTGTDESAVNLACTIIAYVLADRDYKIYPAKVKYGSKSVTTPDVEPREFKFDLLLVKTLLGLDLGEQKVKELLQRAQFDYEGKGKVFYPAYRGDLMHGVDVVEDIAIMHGYDEFEPAPLTSFTAGGLQSGDEVVGAVRKLWNGFGYQEIFSPVLSNKQLLYDKMNAKDMGTVEVENFMSSTYSCVRTWLLPILMDVLSKNRHVEYPQKLMEEGFVVRREKDKVWDARQVAAVSAHAQASFTEMRQHIEGVLRGFGHECKFVDMDEGCTKDSFIQGRSAFIFVNNQAIGFLGEIHPAVLEKFGLLVPVVAAEFGLELLKK